MKKFKDSNTRIYADDDAAPIEAAVVEYFIATDSGASPLAVPVNQKKHTNTETG